MLVVRQLRIRQGRTYLVLHALSLAAAAPVLLWANRRQWFFQDEWDFLTGPRFEASPIDRWLMPHNEHWSTLPLLVYRVLFHVVGVRTYWPYVAALVLLHLALTHVLWKVLLRVRTPPLVATALATVFAVLGTGAENLVWAFQIGFVGSVLLGWLTVLLVDQPRPSRIRQFAATSLATLSLATSGVSLTMVAVATTVVALRRGVLRAAYFATPPVVVFAAWFARYGVREDLNGARLATDLPRFVWEGVTHALSSVTGLSWTGPLLLAALVLALAAGGSWRGQQAPAVAGALGAVLLFVQIGLARVQMGLSLADSLRYVYVATALLLPAVGTALRLLTGRHRVLQPAILLLLTPVLLHNLVALRAYQAFYAAQNAPAKATILAAADLVETQPFFPHSLPEPTFSTALRAGDLRRLVAEGRLAPPPTPDPARTLTVAARIQVELSKDPSAAAPVGSTSQCQQSQGGRWVTWAVSGGATPLVLESPTATDLVLRLRTGTPGVQGEQRTLRLASGRSYLTVLRPTEVQLASPGAVAVRSCLPG